MKILLRDIKPNPFKRQIMEGKLIEGKVQELEASIRETTFWDNIVVRSAPNGVGYELGYGHHRLEAARRVLGDDHVVDIPVREFDDATMLKVMGLENGPDRDVPIQMQIDQVVAAKKWLEEHPGISGSREPEIRGRGRPEGCESGSERDIARFLGEQTWSRPTVHRLLVLHEKLHPDLKERVSTHNQGRVSEAQGLSATAALEIARLPMEEQPEIAEIVETTLLNKEEVRALIKGVKDPVIRPEIKERIKEQVRSGALRGEEEIRREVNAYREIQGARNEGKLPREPQPLVVNAELVQKLTGYLHKVTEALEEGFSVKLLEPSLVIDFWTELEVLHHFYHRMKGEKDEAEA